MASLETLPAEMRVMIYEYLDKTDIKQLRQVSRTVEAEASEFLFPTLIVGFQESYINHLKRVMARREFAMGVKKIVFETLQYKAESQGVNMYDEESVGKLLYRLDSATASIDSDTIIVSNWVALSTTQKTQWKQLGAVALSRFRAMQEYEASIISRFDTTQSFAEHLGTALQSFGRLKSIHMTQWAEERNRAFFDTESLMGTSSLAPPAFLAGQDLIAAFKTQAIALNVVLQALCQSGRQITNFKVLQSSKAILYPVLGAYELPETMLPFSGCVSLMTLPQISHRFARLKSLHLNLSRTSRTDESLIPLIYLKTDIAHVAKFVQRLPSLERLNLAFGAKQVMWAWASSIFCILPLTRLLGMKVHPHLRELTLSGGWLEPDELCDFLLKHRDTLKEVTLTDIKLGGTATPTQHPSGLMHHGGPYVLPDNVHLEWERVVDTLHTLNKLRALVIERPTRGWNRERLDEANTARLVELGMYGRRNNLREPEDVGYDTEEEEELDEMDRAIFDAEDTESEIDYEEEDEDEGEDEVADAAGESDEGAEEDDSEDQDYGMEEDGDADEN